MNSDLGVSWQAASVRAEYIKFALEITVFLLGVVVLSVYLALESWAKAALLAVLVTTALLWNPLVGAASVMLALLYCVSFLL
jgi:hypothetical protein